MTIQPSVLIWTVLSFCALAYILNKFLFKPLLKVMDERNEKITGDKEKKRAELEAREKMLAEAEEERINIQKNAVTAGEQAAEQLHSETAAILVAKKQEYDEALEQLRLRLEEESGSIEQELSGKVDKLALAYVDALIK